MIVINQLTSKGILRILDNLSSVTYYGEVRRLTFEKGRPVANPCLLDQQLNFLSQSWHRRAHQMHSTLLGFHSNNPPQMDFALHHPTLWDHGGAPPPPSSFSIQILFSDLASTLMRLPSLSGPGFPPCEMNWTQDSLNFRNHFMQNPLLVYHCVWWSLGKTSSWLVPVLEGIR